MDKTRDIIVDAVGLLCPLPVLKARKHLREVEIGGTLTLLASDPAAIIDVPHFCAESGHRLLSQSDENGIQTYVIRREI